MANEFRKVTSAHNVSAVQRLRAGAQKVKPRVAEDGP
jgi:hypothetical protein